MLSKKWHKLFEKDEESLKEEKNNEEKEDYNEVIIINMNDDSSEFEKEKEDINEEDKSKNLKMNSIKLKSKPKAILNVDPNSITITDYYIENYIEQNYDDKLKDVINKYSYKMSNKYQDNNIIPNINEIKNKYQINKMENTLYKENDYLSKYIPGMNNISYLNNIKNNKYYNYGPIYNYERKKEKLKEEEKERKDINAIEYKISNPYDNNRKENFILPINNQLSFINKAEIRNNYPNLFYFNNIFKNDILDPLYLDQYSNNNQNIKNIRVDLSAKRSNRKGNNQYIKHSNFINESPNLLFSNKEENKYFIN